MTYTEVVHRSENVYYYRTRSVRSGPTVKKERRYMGRNIGKATQSRKSKEADKELGELSSLLSVSEVKLLEGMKKGLASQPKTTRDNRYEAFMSRFTNDSTVIEGNTLTLQETASLLFEDRLPSGKTMRDVNEVLGHRRAFDHLLAYKGDICRDLILDLHRMVIAGSLAKGLEDQAGVYRTVQVYIRGVEWSPPPPEEIAMEMRTLLSWYTKNREILHPLIVASYFHTGFELVHPFVDGNGRVGRLLLNFIMHKNGYPMINIHNARKSEYYEALQSAQVKGDLRPFVTLMMDVLKRSEILL